MFRTSLLLTSLLALLLIVPAAHATSNIPSCDPPEIPTIYPDGSYGCIVPGGNPPPPAPTPAPTPDPAPAPQPDPTMSPDDTFGDAYESSGWIDTKQTWSTLATSPAGCRTAYQLHRAKSWLLSTLVVQHLEVSFCYQGGRVYGATAVCYPTDLRWTVQPLGCTPVTTFFNWNGKERGGLVVTATGTYHNCAGSLCGSDKTITLEIKVYGNGTWEGRTV